MSNDIVNSKYFFYLLRFQVFISGASVMGLELLGSRLMSPYFGNTLFVWGSLIGITLTGLSAGYSYGGKKSDQKASYQTFSLLIFIAGSYSLLSTLLSAEIFKIILLFQVGEIFGPLISSIILLLVPTFLLGAVTPFALRLSAKSIQTIGQTAGNLYSLSTVGSIFGTFATTFILVPLIGVDIILYSISVILITSAIVGLSKQTKLVAVILICISLYSAVFVQAPLAGVVFEKETQYHRLLVHDDSVTNIRTLILDNNFHSAMDLENRDRIVYEYTKYFHLGMLFTNDVQNVLFIGGGGFSAPKKFFVDYPDIKIDVVEIDKEVVSAGKEFFFVPEDERLDITTDDGRIFLRKTDKKYDIIVLDAYDKTYVPFHLMTKEFHELVSNHLTEDGVLVSNIITSLEGDSATLFLSELKTMNTVYNNIHIYPVVSEQDRIIQNIIIVAQNKEDRITKFELMSRQNNVRVDLSEEIMKEYEKEIELNTYKILEDNFAPVENYLNPLTGKQYVKRIILEDGLASEIVNNNEDWDPELTINQLLFVLIAAVVLVYSIYSYSDTEKNK
mgnify:FL=1